MLIQGVPWDPGLAHSASEARASLGAGPAMLRAAAKNHERVAVIVDPADYGRIAQELESKGSIAREIKEELAAKAFRHTAEYDACIADYLDGTNASQ